MASQTCKNGHDLSAGTYRIRVYDVCKTCHREAIELARKRSRAKRSHYEEMLEDELPRFMSKVRKEPNGCWFWTAANNGRAGGYPVFTIAGRQRLAHRVSLRYFSGPFDEASDVDHLCRNSLCVNPEHLEAVTHDENMARSTIRGAQTIRARINSGHTSMQKVGPPLLSA
jgi:hypothetical protein